MLHRRILIVHLPAILVLGSAAGVLAASIGRIGILGVEEWQGQDKDTVAFVDELRRRGYEEGKNLLTSSIAGGSWDVWINWHASSRPCLVGDTAYGVAPMLDWMVEKKQITPHVPVWDKTGRKDDTLSASEFQWHSEANEYRCPEGHALRSDWRQFKNPRDRITQADTIIYRSSGKDCAQCPAKQGCCPNTPIRKIARSIYESSRDVARSLASTVEYARSRRDRKKVETVRAPQTHPEARPVATARA